MPSRPCQRAYDHRIRDLVCQVRDPALFAQLGIPRSTAASWIQRGSRPVVTAELFCQDEQELRARVLKLERRVQLLVGIVRLLFVLVRLVRVRLDGERVPAGEAKARIISAVERARRRVPLCVALRSIGLSASRYHAWVRLEESCELEDRTSCPRTIPGQLTAREVHRRAEQGDPAAVEAFRRAGHFLGKGIATAVNMLNPERVILGGGVMEAEELLLLPAIREARRRSYHGAFECCSIRKAEMENDAGFLGAAIYARDNSPGKDKSGGSLTESGGGGFQR